MELFSNMNGAETFGVTLGALLEEGRALLAKETAHIWTRSQTPEKMAAILFTSGTSGTSKAVMLSQKNLITSFDCACKHISYTEDDVMLSVLPLHHAYRKQLRHPGNAPYEYSRLLQRKPEIFFRQPEIVPAHRHVACPHVFPRRCINRSSRGKTGRKI